MGSKVFLRNYTCGKGKQVGVCICLILNISLAGVGCVIHGPTMLHVLVRFAMSILQVIHSAAQSLVHVVFNYYGSYTFNVFHHYGTPTHVSFLAQKRLPTLNNTVNSTVQFQHILTAREVYLVMSIVVTERYHIF